MLIVCWSPKGGSGTSVAVSGIAIAASRSTSSAGTLVVDVGGDIPAILGLAEPTIGLSEWISQPSAFALDDAIIDGPSGLKILPRGVSALPDIGSTAWTRLATEIAGCAANGTTVIVDAGRNLDPNSLASHGSLTLAVVRPCYLSIRRARLLDRRLDGVIVVLEPDRVLTPDDIQGVLGVPVVALVPMRSDIARRVDAGILGSRPPAQLVDALAPLLAA